MKKIRRFVTKNMVLTIIILGILFKFFLWLEFTPECCGSDERTYHSVAKNLVLQGQFVYTKSDDSLIWQDKLYGIKPPLYPFFIAAIYKVFGIDPRIVWIFQIAISSATGYLIYLIGKRLVSEKVGIIALTVFSFFWETAHMSLTLMSENLHWFLLMILVLLLTDFKTNNKKYLILLGIILGLMTLNRPTALIFLIFISVWFLWENLKFETIKHLLITYMVFILVILPWSVRNYNLYGQFIYIYTDGALNVWMGNYPQSGGSYNIPNPDIPGQIPVLKYTGVKAEMEHEAYYYNRAFDYMMDNPVEAIDTDIRKVLRTFYLYRPITLNETNVRGTWSLVRPKSLAIDDFWELLVSYQFAILIITFFMSLIFIKRINSRVSTILLLLIVGHLSVIALSIWTPRYTSHMYTLIIPFSAVFLSRINGIFKS